MSNKTYVAVIFLMLGCGDESNFGSSSVKKPSQSESPSNEEQGSNATSKQKSEPTNDVDLVNAKKTTKSDEPNIDESEFSVDRPKPKKPEDECDVPIGTAVTNVLVQGEDVPGNGLVGGPDSAPPYYSDFDDYQLTLKTTSPDVLILDTQVSKVFPRFGVAKKGTVTVVYQRTSTACSHSFEFRIRRCPDKNATAYKTFTMNVGSGDSGSIDLKIDMAEVFIDITETTTGSTRKDFGGCPQSGFAVVGGAVANNLYGDKAPAYRIP